MTLHAYLTGEINFYGRPRCRGDKKGELFDLGSWKEHHDLHCFIVERFANGGYDNRPIYLGEAEVERVIKGIENGELPNTRKFFLAKPGGSENPSDLEIFKDAFKWMNAELGDDEWRYVFYQAGW